jgi:hypothetical protein
MILIFIFISCCKMSFNSEQFYAAHKKAVAKEIKGHVSTTGVTVKCNTSVAIKRVMWRSGCFYLRRKRLDTHCKTILGVDVPEALHVIEHQPGQGNYHQNDERN